MDTWTNKHQRKLNADELAKEAAEEAKLIPEDSQILTGQISRQLPEYPAALNGKGLGMLQILIETCTITSFCVFKDPSIHVGPFHRRTKRNFLVEAWLYFE